MENENDIMENNHVIICDFKPESVNDISFNRLRNHPNVATKHIANFYEYAQCLWRRSELVWVSNPNPQGIGIGYAYGDTKENTYEFEALDQIIQEYRKVNPFQIC